MTPSDIQTKIDRIIDRSFKPTREQKISSILVIVSSLKFEAVLAHALKVQFGQDNLSDLSDQGLDDLFQMARTWRYQADQVHEREDAGTVVSFRSGDH